MRKNLILDTCALVWLVAGDKSLSDSTRKEINAARLVYVSAISAWEVSLKAAKKELVLPLKPVTWFRKSVEGHRLSLADLSLDVLTHANDLPWHHRDPADRFIIATALLHGLDVVTADRRFPAYGVNTLC